MKNSNSRRQTPTRLSLAILSSAMLLGTFSNDANALGSDTVFISANAGVSYDDNLFRLDRGEPTPRVNASRDDLLYRFGLGLSADVPVSRQRFRANLNITDYRYSRNSYLNYVGGSGSASWLWAVGEDWHGDLGASQSRSLQSFDYANAQQSNVIANQTYFFNPRYRLAPNFELQGGLNYTTVTNSFDQAKFSDYKQTGLQLGIAYIFPSANSVGLQLQSWSVKFNTSFVVNNSTADNAYRDNRVSTFFNAQLTGKSSVDGSIGYKQRRHENLPERDFNGWTGSVGWVYNATGRISMRLLASRDVGGIEDIATTYARTYSLVIAPTYRLTSKINLSGTAQFQDLRFLGDTGSRTQGLNIGQAGRHDKTYTLGVGGGYAATRTFRLGFNYAFTRRDSSAPLVDYDDNLIGLSGQFTF
ncbi:MAG: XrtB/PEP-CTERM-associated polysaccharide biosynthesis outer membrane protein EpsL [Betaproteobacteria bacterium]